MEARLRGALDHLFSEMIDNGGLVEDYTGRAMEEIKSYVRSLPPRIDCTRSDFYQEMEDLCEVYAANGKVRRAAAGIMCMLEEDYGVVWRKE